MSLVNYLLAEYKTPFLTTEGLWTSEHFYPLQTGISVRISKKVTPNDQTSGELSPFQISSCSWPNNCLIIYGARYSGETNHSRSPFSTPQSRFQKWFCLISYYQRNEEQPHYAILIPYGKMNRFDGFILLFRTFPQNWTSCRQTLLSNADAYWQLLAIS